MNAPSEDIKILIVGSNQIRINPLYKYLVSMHVCPITAISGKDAIEIYRREQADIILMDEKLPDISCIEFCRSIRELDTRNNWTSIMFLSSATDIGNFERKIHTEEMMC